MLKRELSAVVDGKQVDQELSIEKLKSMNISLEPSAHFKAHAFLEKHATVMGFDAGATKFYFKYPCATGLGPIEGTFIRDSAANLVSVTGKATPTTLTYPAEKPCAGRVRKFTSDIPAGSVALLCESCAQASRKARGKGKARAGVKVDADAILKAIREEQASKSAPAAAPVVETVEVDGVLLDASTGEPIEG